jgi:hypothetical protein
MKKKNRLLLVGILFLQLTAYAKEPPRIADNGKGVKQLIVDGKPFIFLSGELHNSTASHLGYLEPRMKDLQERHLNSVIATVSWELFEPREGDYDYTLVKGIIDQARKYDMKLILIWFATWKNTWSTYAPEWVKRDIKRFPRMQRQNASNSGALSAFGENTMKADAKAYAELMKYIREYDADEQTVLMMQVQNETGVIGTSRDRSNAANAAFRQKVPQELMNYLKQHEQSLIPELKQMWETGGKKADGTWQEVFSYGADEVFSAWYIGKYVNEVTKTGKAVYDIPMFVNAWLDPGFSEDLTLNYPSGGPVSKMFDVWRAAAPSVDLFAADIYLDDFKRVCAQYTQSGNPLFIPELKPDIRQGAYVYYAIGQNAMCFAPFAIDGFSPVQKEALAGSYQSLKGFLPFFSQHSGKDKNIGLLYTGKKEETFRMGDYNVQIQYTQERDVEKGIPESAGLILQTGKDEFYVCGRNINVSFHPLPGQTNDQIELISHDEGSFADGVWHPERRMNGDERAIRIITPSIRKVVYHMYK